MSADNMICVQRRGDQWWVWMDFMSNDNPAPRPNDAIFGSVETAQAFATGWLRGEMIVEYGIIHLPPTDEKGKTIKDLDKDNVVLRQKLRGLGKAANAVLCLFFKHMDSYDIEDLRAIRRLRHLLAG